MSDDLQNRGAVDRRRINLDQGHEIQYWTKKFGCSAEELEQAVGRVGHSAARVKRSLLGTRKPSAAAQ